MFSKPNLNVEENNMSVVVVYSAASPDAKEKVAHTEDPSAAARSRSAAAARSRSARPGSARERGSDPVLDALQDPLAVSLTSSNGQEINISDFK